MSKKSNKVVKVLEPVVKEFHRSVIDEYYTNGFKGNRAVVSIREQCNMKECTPSVNSTLFKSIIENEANGQYIAKKQTRLRAMTDIHNEQILKELINWAYCDITDFITLDKEGIKELPADVRRCIQSYKSTTKTYEQRDGTKETVYTVEVKLIDKAKALESISKHIGFYLEDNRQKRPTINIGALNIEQLNILNQLMIPQKTG